MKDCEVRNGTYSRRWSKAKERRHWVRSVKELLGTGSAQQIQLYTGPWSEPRS